MADDVEAVRRPTVASPPCDRARPNAEFPWSEIWNGDRCDVCKIFVGGGGVDVEGHAITPDSRCDHLWHKEDGVGAHTEVRLVASGSNKYL